MKPCWNGGRDFIKQVLCAVVLALFASLFLSVVTASAQCCGDCNSDGAVTMDEILTGVNNALNACQRSSAPTPTLLGTYIFSQTELCGLGWGQCYDR